MEPSPAHPPSPQPTGGVPGWIAPTALALAGAWAVGTTVLGQAASWLAEQTLVITGYDRPAAFWPGLSVLIALLAGAPAGLLGVLVQRPALAAIARSWAVAAGCAAALGLARIVPWSAGDATVSGLAALVAGALVLLLDRRERRARRRLPRTGVQPAGSLARAGGIGVAGALAVGLAGLAPWWWAGALGGPFDVVLAGLAAVALGALVARVRRRGVARVVVGGPVAGLIVDVLVVTVPLTLLAGASGPAGGQLALLLTLPAAALAVAATDPRSLRPATLLVAAAAFGPLALVDGEEVTLLLLPDDVPRWTAIGALTSGLVLFLAGVAAIVVVGVGIRARAVAGGLVAAAVLASAVVWVSVGDPGFHGDRLFVVLKSQAKLTATTGTPAARRKAVYDQLVAHAQRSQAPLLAALGRVGANPTSYYLVNAVEVDDNPVIRAVLAAREDVASVRPNPELRPIPSTPSPGAGELPAPTGTPTNLVAIKAPQAWAAGIDGRGLVVGFSDSGVDARHPALRAGYRGGADSWYDPWRGTTTPTDPNGHGTHTAGSAVGRGTGVAPGARWIGCADLARPLGNPAYYVSCLQFMLAPFGAGGNPLTDGDPSRGADILSNSWGCPSVEGCAAGTLKPAVDALTAAGVFVVAAAGNTGPHCGSVTDPPANYGQAFTVGASDNNGTIADFSSRGPVAGGAKPDLVAPGEDVLSAWPGGGYRRLSGTSMAAPQVAGVVALVWQAAPSLRGDITRTAALLRTSAQPAALGSGDTTCGGNERNVIGAGLVDAAAAVTLARRLAPL